LGAELVSCVAIIPARGGSKGVRRKNIAPVGGRPLLAWTIETARAARTVNRIVVTTDDAEIAKIANDHNAEVPFLRPASLATDYTSGMDVLLHAVRWLEENEGYHSDWVLLLQPTSPLRTAEDIDTAFSIATAHNADAVVSANPAQTHPYWMKKIESDGRFSEFFEQQKVDANRQELPPAFALNGAIYLIKNKTLLSQQNFFNSRTYAYVMPQERSLDVDTEWDLHLADLVLRDRR
jgi:CMP-N,N'-diacetyllegionaminic acid synthase